MLDRLGIASADPSRTTARRGRAARGTPSARVRTLLLTNCDTEIDSPPPALLPVIELAKAGKFVDSWLAPWLADTNLARSTQGLGGMTYTFPEHLSDEAIAYYLTPLCAPHRKTLVHAYAIALERNPLAGIERADAVWSRAHRSKPATRSFGEESAISIAFLPAHANYASSRAPLFFPGISRSHCPRRVHSGAGAVRPESMIAVMDFWSCDGNLYGMTGDCSSRVADAVR
jgi:hypothetical protein